MPRRYSSSQFRSKVRQIQQKQRQAINQAVNKYKQDVRRQEQKQKTAINKLHQALRTYETRRRANLRRMQSELNRLSRQSATVKTRYVTYRSSVKTLHTSYTQLESYADAHEIDPAYNRMLDLSERETANSLEVTNRILGDEEAGSTSEEPLENAELLDGLRRISLDLDDRWNGAVYALDPGNPDAARHFCTSAREIMTQILEIKAPDADVFASLPDCTTTQQGNPTRRSKIRYFLHRRGMVLDQLEEFVEQDMENIVQLFNVFNTGTHGEAGAFDLPQLQSIRKRVENGIMFLTEIIGER